jgi:hypothetical protein
MTGNPHFPSPTPTMAAFEAHIDAAAKAQSHILVGPIGSAAQRDARLAAVRSDLEPSAPMSKGLLTRARGRGGRSSRAQG